MSRIPLQTGKISSLYLDHSDNNEHYFGVELFLGNPESPSASFDLTALSQESALKLFRTLETHVSKSTAKISLSNFAPELLEQLKSEL